VPEAPKVTVWEQEPKAYAGVPWGTPAEDAKRFLASTKRDSDEFGAIWLTDIGDVRVREIFTYEYVPPATTPGLVKVRWIFNSNGFASLAETLTAKFGTPHDKNTSTIQNRMGAAFENVLLSWSGPTAMVMLSKYGATATEGLAVFQLRSYAEEKDRAKAATEKAAKDKF
jgi:hypothetical protein